MFNVLFWGVSAISTLILYLALPQISLWFILPLLLASYVGAVFLFFVFLFVSSLFLPQTKPVTKPKPFCAFMIRTTMAWLMQIFRVKIKLTGTELLPKEPCILVSNHRSDFDPMAVLAVLKGRKLAYISKDANFKIPIVGNYIHNAGFLAIDRGNGMRALRTLVQAAKMIENEGVDIGIYPEGTRSKSGELLRFRPGAFILSKRANAPIVVMVTKGTESITKNAFLRKTTVELKILGVISIEKQAELEQDALSTLVREMIEEGLK